MELMWGVLQPDPNLPRRRSSCSRRRRAAAGPALAKAEAGATGIAEASAPGTPRPHRRCPRRWRGPLGGASRAAQASRTQPKALVEAERAAQEAADAAAAAKSPESRHEAASEAESWRSLDEEVITKDDFSGEIAGEGVLEVMPDGYVPSARPTTTTLIRPTTLHVSPLADQAFGLKPGDTVSGAIRPPKEGEEIPPAGARQRDQRPRARVHRDRVQFEVHDRRSSRVRNSASRATATTTCRRASSTPSRHRQGPARADRRPAQDG